jgi:hypothetical protein
LSGTVALAIGIRSRPLQVAVIAIFSCESSF